MTATPPCNAAAGCVTDSDAFSIDGSFGPKVGVTEKASLSVTNGAGDAEGGQDAPNDGDETDAREGAIAEKGPDAAADPATAVLALPIANTSPMQSPMAERYPNRWHKGQSGNPNGRPLGSRHRATLLAESLLDGQSEELIQKTIELALGGDTTALRICMDRIIAPRRDRPLSFRLPAINSAQDAVAAIAAITDGVASGDLTPAEAAELAKVIEIYRSTIETAEFERRLRALEEARDGGS